MRRYFFTLFIFLCMALLGSAQAACGGGGWKSNAPKDAHANASASTATPAAQNVSYQATQAASHQTSPDDIYYAPRAHALDTSRLDAVSAKLDLTKDQNAKIDEARHDIATQVVDLNTIKINSERAFDACTGACETERLRMRKAIEAAQHFSAATEFDKHLRLILDARQIAIYEARQEVSTK